MATTNSLKARGTQNAYDSIAASQTDSVLVAAISGRRIRVRAYIINQGDTTPSTVTFNSKGAGAGTAIMPPLKFAANGGIVAKELEPGYFQTNVGEALTVTTGAGSTTSVAVVWEPVG
jgi:hypothetical protein